MRVRSDIESRLTTFSILYNVPCSVGLQPRSLSLWHPTRPCPAPMQFRATMISIG
jgi:hypothetical protein